MCCRYYIEETTEMQAIVSEGSVIGEFYKCKIARSSRRSKDSTLVKRLYEFSEELENESGNG